MLSSADYEKAVSSDVKKYYESYWILWKAAKGQEFNERFYKLTLAPRLEFLSLETLLSKSLLALSSDHRSCGYSTKITCRQN